MSDSNYFDGVITITPPLTAREIRYCPMLTDLKLRVAEHVEPTDEGEIVRRTADAVVPDCQGMEGHRIVAELCQLIASFGVTHAFAGHIEVHYPAGYGGPGVKRIVLREGLVETVEPRLVWPGDEPAPGGRLEQVWSIIGETYDYPERFATRELAQHAAEIQWRNENEPGMRVHSAFEWLAADDRVGVFEAYIGDGGLDRVATEWSVRAQPVVWSRPDEEDGEVA